MTRPAGDGLLADKERLDWLQRTGSHACLGFPPEDGWHVWIGPISEWTAKFSTIRAALNAAMEQCAQ